MAADISDPIVRSTTVPTIVLSLTITILALSFRSQNKAIQEQAYQNVMDDYGDAMRMLSERPELYSFQTELFKMRGQPLGQEQRSYSRKENGHPQLRHHALRILRKNPLPLQTKVDRRGYLEAMSGVS